MNPHGLKLKSEIRYYRKDHEGVYFAFNGFYTKDFRNTEIGYYYSNDSSAYRIDNFNVRKIAQGLNVILGRQSKTGKHAGYDMYAGLGIRFVGIRHYNIEFEKGKDVLRGPQDYNLNHMRNAMDAEGGHSILPNFSSGVRIIYAFK